MVVVWMVAVKVYFFAERTLYYRAVYRNPSKAPMIYEVRSIQRYMKSAHGATY
jgi:hypothetical protein